MTKITLYTKETTTHFSMKAILASKWWHSGPYVKMHSLRQTTAANHDDILTQLVLAFNVTTG